MPTNIVSLGPVREQGGLAPANADRIVAMARQHFGQRRRRDRLSSPDLFSEPAWDMLLNLLIASREGQRLSVKALMLGSGAPHSTAHRYLGLLEGERLVSRTPDECDARRVFVELTERGRGLLAAVLLESS